MFANCIQSTKQQLKNHLLGAKWKLPLILWSSFAKWVVFAWYQQSRCSWTFNFACSIYSNFEWWAKKCVRECYSNCELWWRHILLVHGHGRTGKTLLWKTKAKLLCLSPHRPWLLLPGGWTAHLRFKIPSEVDKYSTCEIKKGTQHAINWRDKLGLDCVGWHAKKNIDIVSPHKQSLRTWLCEHQMGNEIPPTRHTRN